MPRSRYKIYDPQDIHFLTHTVLNWTPIFTRPETVNIIINSLHYLQQHHQMKLYGYVILENHMHWIAKSEDLPKDLLRFKSFTAKMIIRHLQNQGQTKVLKQLSFYKKAHKSDRHHQFWEDGSHPQQIQGEEMLRQKLEYIHQNPVKRGYVDEDIHWRYSSARNYAGDEGLIEVHTKW